jgi:hypothetical protein
MVSKTQPTKTKPTPEPEDEQEILAILSAEELDEEECETR